MFHSCKIRAAYLTLLVGLLIGLTGSAYAGNEVLGELQLRGASKVEKGSGVWVDGQYVGFLKELKGSKKVLLLPGEHEIIVRQAGYHDFHQTVKMQPGEKESVQVKMEKDTSLQYPKVTAEVQTDVTPDRAAIFVDGLLVGHASEFEGIGKAMLVTPGKRKIMVSLPGYKTFETELDLAPNQKFKLTTSLVWDGAAGTENPAASKN